MVFVQMPFFLEWPSLTPGTRLYSADSCSLSADVYQSDLALCVSVGFVGGELIYNLWWLVALCFRPFTF